MEKRFQVFVSSTYEDLREERQEVMQALLELDCIPSGMELFPAATDDQWSIIKKVIEDCDYYIVLVAGRYGSIGKDNKSYTQMEYEYAVEAEKPVLGFIHQAPSEIAAAKTESTEKGKALLDSFRSLVKQRPVKTFRTPSELGSVVSRSIVKLMKSHPASGWIRADEAVSELSASEILKLRKENDELRTRLAMQTHVAPPGAETLAQGNDLYEILFDIEYTVEGSGRSWSRVAKLSWNDICKTVLPLAMSDSTEATIAKAIETRCLDQIEASLRRTKEKGAADLTITLIDDELRTILIQLEALGLIERAQDGNTKAARWKLTPYGQAQLVAIFAIKKPRAKPLSP